ncbi:MAG TPA: class I SAM-dependent methyltransferase [Patescibacteria group bacterium]|nr:class I SAM-dependent methyltransferase [Patescibacteria group bacterium]
MTKKQFLVHERLVPDRIPWFQIQMLWDHVDRYKFVVPYIKSKTVLDIACGSGYGTLYLAENGAKNVLGMDLSTSAITYAKKHYSHKNVLYSVGNAESIPLKNNSIDVLVSFETIEHLNNYKNFIKEIQRVLKKNGLLIISTPNNITGTGSKNPYHKKEFTFKEFRQLIEKQFVNINVYGQKPVLVKYIKFINEVTKMIKNEKLRWMADTIGRIIFRGSKVMPIGHIRNGFEPLYVIIVGKNNK